MDKLEIGYGDVKHIIEALKCCGNYYPKINEFSKYINLLEGMEPIIDRGMVSISLDYETVIELYNLINSTRSFIKKHDYIAYVDEGFTELRSAINYVAHRKYEATLHKEEEEEHNSSIKEPEIVASKGSIASWGIIVLLFILVIALTTIKV